MVIIRGWERVEWGASVQWERISVWEDEKVLQMGSDEGCRTMGMYLTLPNCALENA